MIRIAALFVTALVACLALAGCGGSAPPAVPATVTVTAPANAPSTSPAADPNARITLPEVSGRNGRIVLEDLRKAGLTNVQPASQDEEDKVVINAANWTATKIEPGAGTEVGAGDTVVVTMTKKK